MTKDTEPRPLLPLFRSLRTGSFIAIAAKLAILALLYALFFSPAHRPHVDAASVSDHILPPR